MSTVSILNELQQFLQDEVASTIQLQAADDNNINNYRLMNPNVFTGWIPPQGYLPDEMEAAIPCMVVGFDEGSDDLSNTNLNIRISFAVYSPGEHILQDDKVTYTPSFKGYNDLLNLIDRAKAELIRNTIISKKFVVDSEIKFGMYQDQPYPYWYGWLTFTARSNSYPKAKIEKLLL